MAKLSAYGRQELIRIEKTTQGENEYYGKYTEIKTRVYMTDRTILQKTKIVYEDGKSFPSTWKKYGKVKKSIPVESIAQTVKDMTIKANWKVLKYNPDAKTKKRIRR